MAGDLPASAPQPPPPPKAIKREPSDESDETVSATASTAASEDGGDASPMRLADSWAFLQGGPWDRELPVEGARLYNLCVRPVGLPSLWLKALAFPIFWVICLVWHHVQRRAQLDWHVPGEPGTRIELVRSLPGGTQVALNALCVVVLSTYALTAYIFHERILALVLNKLFIPRTWLGHYAVAAVMYSIAIASSFFLTTNWVPAAAGLFLFFGYAVCGRSVQASASHRSQVGLGPSRAEEDRGMSFHIEGAAGVESGCGKDRAVQGVLLGGEAKDGSETSLRFVSLQPDYFVLGDDAILVDAAEDGSRYTYRGPCGRANIFRLDCLLVLAASFGARLPWFLIGGGDFNQCAGLTELIASLLYIPVGYTCFAVFGFRVGLANGCSMAVVLVLCFWPIVNLVLGGKGCATLTELIGAQTLPQIWDASASTLTFDRGFASCTESAFGLGGETLLVASTTIAAWVHIMSNFSFLLGFASGLLRKRCGLAGKGPTVLVR